MNLHKAITELTRLVDEEPDDTAKFAMVDALLNGFDRANRFDGLPWSYASEKIGTVRGWFAILCGIGEDGDWSDEHLRTNLRVDIGKLRYIVSESGLGIHMVS